VYHVVGLPVAVLSLLVTSVLLTLAATVVLVVPSLPLLVRSTRAFTRLQQSRVRDLLGVDIAVSLPDFPGTGMRRLWAEVRAGATWRQVGYHLVAPLITSVHAVIVVAAWSIGVAGTAVIAYSWALPERGLFGWSVRHPVTLAGLTLLGLGCLAAAPWVARALATVDVALARRLLGPSRVEELTRRVDSLTASREAVVDAADAERRRIERDLHDGTQQRLVSLAMNLGLARAKLADAPEPARRAIEEAHEEAKEALAELRAFIRGLHPAVLDDRGLDAALSGIAARAPLPVTVRSNLPHRCSATIEAVAYFVVSEALTNAARHAGATRAEVAAEHVDGRLRIAVTDDGRGGADPERGTGLRGLAQRVAAVDGTLRIDSPAGGPTVIVAELPCER
jgi:signal transduction histidine kinase